MKPLPSRKMGKVVSPQYSSTIIQDGEFVLKIFPTPRINVMLHQIKWALDRAKVEEAIPESVKLENTPLSVMIQRGYVAEIATTLFPTEFKISVEEFEKKVAYAIFNFQASRINEEGGWEKFASYMKRVDKLKGAAR